MMNGLRHWFFGSGLVCDHPGIGRRRRFRGAAALDAFAKPRTPQLSEGYWKQAFLFMARWVSLVGAFFWLRRGYLRHAGGPVFSPGVQAGLHSQLHLPTWQPPSIFWGPDYTRFYSATGYATMIGQVCLCSALARQHFNDPKSEGHRTEIATII